MGSPIPQASFNCGDNPRYGPGKTRLMDPHPFWIQIDRGSAQLTFMHSAAMPTSVGTPKAALPN